MIVDVQKYNLIRAALAAKSDIEENVDLIVVPPRALALKKVHDEDVLLAAMELLDDPRIVTGITPVDTLKSFKSDQELTPEVAMYVMVCYAIAIQQGWIIYSPILNNYRVNQESFYAKEYVEDTHKVKVE